MSDYAYNRQAIYEYEILEKYEAGLVLAGFEVKSIRTGHISLQGAYVVIRSNEAYLLNATISPYQPKNTPAGYEPTRSRKLLLHQTEIASLVGLTKQKGLTLVPLRVYNKLSKIKLAFALARGKKQYDKREIIKKREFLRQKERIIKGLE
jgi:SsrA-binding protein